MVVLPLPPPLAGEVTATGWRGKVELRHWERDGHPEVRDSAEAAAGGGQEPAGGESCGRGVWVEDGVTVLGKVLALRVFGAGTGLTDLPHILGKLLAQG